MTGYTYFPDYQCTGQELKRESGFLGAKKSCDENWINCGCVQGTDCHATASMVTFTTYTSFQIAKTNPSDNKCVWVRI